MKKIIYALIIAVLFLPLFSVEVFCTENSGDISENTGEELFSIMDYETLKALEEFGIESIDYTEIYDVSFDTLIDYFSTDIKEKATQAVKLFVTLSAMILIIFAIKTLADESFADIIDLLSTMIITLIVVMNLNSVINSVLSVINVSSKFMMGYIPIFAGLLALSGNPSAALTYNTLALAVCEGISAFSNSIAISIIGVFYCLSISFSMNENFNLSRLVSAFSRVCSVALGFVASVFASFLSIRGIMSANVDTVSAKGIRFIISSAIPVVGSAISDAYSSLLGSLSIIKGSVAFIGILSCLIINIPAITQALLYFTVLSVLSFFCEAASNAKVSQLLKAFAAGIKFLLLIQIFEMFVLIISTGLMMNMKSAI